MSSASLAYASSAALQLRHFLPKRFLINPYCLLDFLFICVSGPIVVPNMNSVILHSSFFLNRYCSLGMVKRTLGPCKPEVKDTAYNMLVRPKLEYASPIWNPHKSSQISRLERIQHYAARFVANDHRRTTSPTTRATTLVLTLNCLNATGHKSGALIHREEPLMACHLP